MRVTGAFRFLIYLLLMVVTVARGSAAQQSRTLRGTVVDSSGSPVQGARIEFESASSETRLAASDAQGNFSIADVTGDGTLFVSYPGFAMAILAVRADSNADHLDARLTPASADQRIVVTAAGNDRVPAEPSSQFVVSRQDMQTTGGLSLDDVLRQAPGFTLLRRSSSLFANPTSQGVSLRGVGSNGASRAAVLLDGIPINDPFGGWVYWTQVPRVSIESVQVLNGGASDMYGGGALGGVVNIQSRPVRSAFASVEASYGNESTPDGSFDAGVLLGSWAISAAGQALHTLGYILVPQGQRGAVDTPAGTSDLAGSLTVSRKLGQQGMVFVCGNLFGESRENGTPVTTNNTRMPSIDVGWDWSQARAGAFSARVYGSSEVFNQKFSSVAANRNSEFLTDRQRSPSQQVGFAGQWRRSFGKQAVTAGIEGRDVQGHSAETTFTAVAPKADVDSGGRQRIIGYFAQDAVQIARTWLLTFGGRVDTWLNSRGYANSFPLPAGPLTVTDFANRSQTAFSPRISLLHTLGHGISASATAYRGFRAPTLNELYRNFRVGNTQTNANPNLQAEILTGGEAGVSLQEWGERVTTRGNLFWSDIANPVTNVPISYTPAGCVSNPTTCTLITQQRQNLGVARARGVELSAEWQLPKGLRLSGEYILTDSTVLSAPAQPTLVGLRVPQVPLNGFNAQFSWTHPKWTAGVQTRFASNQFDDAANLFPLGHAFTVDADVSRQLLHGASVFVAAQNLFADRYIIARTPITDVAPPVLARAGLRFDFP
jgi:outer membrane receptor protein involved in Fe transport